METHRVVSSKGPTFTRSRCWNSKIYPFNFHITEKHKVMKVENQPKESNFDRKKKEQKITLIHIVVLHVECV